MIPFAFYGRVSTEDQQDPESSRAWQLHRSRQLIEPHGGIVMAEFFDIGLSRSMPWKRRPEAIRLLESFKDPHRGFTNVVVGEPQRAFYGHQFSLTFPVFTHYNVTLWVPEVGGPIDPGSEAHDLVMTLFGGMSKSERTRIKTRVRSAMTAQAATQGRYLGGRPPYGYRLGDAGPHPNPEKAREGLRAHQLEADPNTAPVVLRIFTAYAAGKGYYAIAEELTADDIPSPSGADRARNPHRHGLAWGKSAVRSILLNPRYTGHQVWNKQRRDEVLMDIDDVGAGHQTVMRWNDQDTWVWSTEPAHEALVSRDLFEAVQERINSQKHTRKPRKGRPEARLYLLRGRLWCGLCGRRMQGNHNHGENYYRCRYASEYASSLALPHPKTVYLREADLLPELDDWLGRIFDPDHIDETCRAMADESDDSERQAAEVARLDATVKGCQTRLNQYRAALDAGTDPTVVAGWIDEVRREQADAERRLAELRQTPERLEAAEIRSAVEQIGGLVPILRKGAPTDRAAFYEAVELRGDFNPHHRTVAVEARVRMVRVGGAMGTLTPLLDLAGERELPAA